MDTITKVSVSEQKIESLSALVESQSAQIDELKMQITDLTLLVKHYEERFKLSQRKLYGSSSEKSPDQLCIDNMFNEAEDQADLSLPEPTYEEITYKRKKRVGKRDEDIDGLPVERIDYELPEEERACPECGDAMRDIGTTVRRELEIIPAKVVCMEHATHAYGCAKCGKNGDKTPIVRAESPEPLISGSLASPSAVSHIIVQKYSNGTPLHRQEKAFLYDGVILSRQTMANWLVKCSQNYLSHFYALLITFLLKENVLHADETTVQVIKEEGRAAQTKSFEWLYRTGSCSKHQIVIFEYQETRKQEHPQRFLKDFKGFLHTDGYKAYHNLPKPDIIVSGCWAHCRRYWEKLYESLDKNKRDGSNAERGLVYCNLMFALEHDYRDLEPKERYESRLKFSKPVSDDFFQWVGSLNALPKSLLGEAITYTLSQREYLENIFLDGRLELSNNLAERAIKPFVQGRKVWLFSFTPSGAESSSIIYSIIETAKANNLNPFEYIKFLLEKLPRTKTSDMESLLPWSEALPDYCRVPAKSLKKAPEKPKYSDKKGPLRDALEKLREKYRNKESE